MSNDNETSPRAAGPLNVLERKAIAIGQSDPRESIGPVSEHGRLRRFLFGTPRRFDLANKHLEALRVLTVATRFADVATIETATALLSKWGFELDQVNAEIGALAA